MRETIRNLENQLRSADEVNAEIEAKSELRKQNIQRMNRGTNPIYLNKGELHSFLMIGFLPFRTVQIQGHGEALREDQGKQERRHEEVFEETTSQGLQERAGCLASDSLC